MKLKFGLFFFIFLFDPAVKELKSRILKQDSRRFLLMLFKRFLQSISLKEIKKNPNIIISSVYGQFFYENNLPGYRFRAKL